MQYEPVGQPSGILAILKLVPFFESNLEEVKTYSLGVKIDVVALDIGQELRCAFDKRYSGRMISSGEDIKKASAADQSNDIFMRGTFRKIRDKDGPLVMHRDLSTTTVLCTVFLSFLRGAFNAIRYMVVSKCTA